MIGLFEYSIAVLGAFLGIFGGMILSWLAAEERKPGMKYFVAAESLLLSLMVSAICFVYFGIVVSAVAGILSVFLFVYTRKFRKSYFMYPLLGALVAFSLKTDNLFLTECVLVFIYGLVVGTMITDPKQKKWKTVFETLIYHVWFLVAALAVWGVFVFI